MLNNITQMAYAQKFIFYMQKSVPPKDLSEMKQSGKLQPPCHASTEKVKSIYAQDNSSVQEGLYYFRMSRL